MLVPIEFAMQVNAGILAGPIRPRHAPELPVPLSIANNRSLYLPVLRR